ncbi:MAG: hypothetical protein ACR2H3_02970 [Acidimicrobiales bacterium]
MQMPPDSPFPASGASKRRPPIFHLIIGLVLLAVVGAAEPAFAVVGPPRPDNLPLADLRPNDGYRLVGGDGGLFAFGHQTFDGAVEPSAGSAPIVGAAQTPTGDGYWMVGRDGGVFAFGDAVFAGSLAGTTLNSPIVSIARTRSGQGYWLVATDGGVFAFGDAAFLGGMGGERLGERVVGIAANTTGTGYWIVAADGGVFAFGDADYHGGVVGTDLNAAVVDIAPTSSGDGYWVAARDGGVFSFCDATWHGSLRKNLRRGIVAIVGGMGWGPLSTPPPPDPVLLPVPSEPVRRAAKAAGPDSAGLTGNDISYPQCGGAYPDPGFGFGIVGVTGGRALRTNPCLADQWRWARSSGRAGVYINVNFPKVEWEIDAGATGPKHDCVGEISCIAFNFGYNGAVAALRHADRSGVDVPFVWLDIETMNYWTDNTELNSVAIRGAIEAVRKAGKDVGIYSTDYQWTKIAGGFAPGLPVWVAGAPDMERAQQWCNRAFGGGRAVMVQTIPVRFDENVMCPGAGPVSRYFAG